jgi:AraC family transcriptional regulator of adaptative response/methylated-DNA-[protein]-cysteine methyltransferase
LAETNLGDIFSRNSRASISLHLRGSAFQLKIWRSLASIPESYLLSYAGLAARAGCPGASRAAGSALASNPIGYLIPCHRVLRADGHMGGFKWGIERKMAMITYEYRLRDSD